MSKKRSGPDKPSFGIIRGGAEAPKANETFLQWSRRLVAESFRSKSDDTPADHLSVVSPLPEEPVVVRATIPPKGVYPIEWAPSYRYTETGTEGKGTSGLSLAPTPTSAEGELMTAQQRMAKNARRVINIEHSMGPSSADPPEDRPPVV